MAVHRVLTSAEVTRTYYVTKSGIYDAYSRERLVAQLSGNLLLIDPYSAWSLWGAGQPPEPVDLNAVFSTGEAAARYGITTLAANLACIRGRLIARQSMGGPWIIDAQSAERYWGERHAARRIG